MTYAARMLTFCRFPQLRRAVMMICLMTATTFVGAQTLTPDSLTEKPSKKERFLHFIEKVDSVMGSRYYKTKKDTSYIIRPEGRVTLKVRVNLSGDDFNIRGTVNDLKCKSRLHTRFKNTISIGASYLGIGASFSINPAKMSGKYTDYEFSLAFNNSRLSLEGTYHRSTTLSGYVEYGDNTGYIEENDLTLKSYNLAAYYVFNHKHFSYPAALTQSYIQRRSVGSWLLGLSYQGGTIETREELKERRPEAPDLYLRISKLGIGGGYGYNLVLGKHRQWLLHGSMTPTFVIYNNDKLIVNGEPRYAGSIRLNMIFNERLAIVWNFRPRFFASATFNINTSIFDDKALVVNQNKWHLRATVGMRLWPIKNRID